MNKTASQISDEVLFKLSASGTAFQIGTEVLEKIALSEGLLAQALKGRAVREALSTPNAPSWIVQLRAAAQASPRTVGRLGGMPTLEREFANVPALAREQEKLKNMWGMSSGEGMGLEDFIRARAQK